MYNEHIISLDALFALVREEERVISLLSDLTDCGAWGLDENLDLFVLKLKMYIF